MKHRGLTIRLMMVLVLLLSLALTGTAMAQDPEPNDPPPEALPVEPEPPIPAVRSAESAVVSGVVPASVAATLEWDESVVTEKTVTLPETTPRLDMVLMVDLSGSYNNDLPNIKSKAPNIFTGVRNQVADSQFGLTTFVDYPFSPWGSSWSGDYAYWRNQDLTTDQTTWLTAINAMYTRSGADGPESQYVALYQAATGAGQTVDGYTIPAGHDPSWRDGVTHVIAITTDAPFHNAGDYGYYFPYPGPTRDATVAALNARNIKVIAIKAPGASTQMDDVASATGGAVAYTSNTSQQIVEAILSALEELTFTVTPVPVGCGPLQFTFSPSSHSGVGGGESVDFTETIAVPWGTTPGTYTCQVEFQADGTVVGTQEVSIEVPSPNQPPTADPNGPYLFPVNAGPFDGTGSSDPDGDTLTYDWYWGDGSSSPDASATPSHTYAAAGIYDVCLTVTDPGGLSDTACTYAVVYDPDGGFVTGGGWIDSPYGALRLDTALPFFEGSYYELVEVPYVAWPAANVAANAAILEGCEYPHLVSITSQDEQDALYEFFDGDLQGKWYGGFQNEGETDPAAGWNWVTGEPWDYTNWAPGEPNDGYGPGTEPHLIGWLDGWAWNDEGNLGNVTGYVVEYEKCGPIGKANFGFVSKYKKGATTPTGNTEFQFHAADLNFHSSSYDWLVVTGSDYARFKGVGTINGMGEYKFMLWAGDDDPDTFRIKIWEEDEYGVETVIYDNGFDQAIGGGSIVIHTKGK